MYVLVTVVRDTGDKKQDVYEEVDGVLVMLDSRSEGELPFELPNLHGESIKKSLDRFSAAGPNLTNDYESYWAYVSRRPAWIDDPELRETDPYLPQR